MNNGNRRTTFGLEASKTIAKLQQPVDGTAEQEFQHSRLEYIEAIASELSELSRAAKEDFLAYLFGMAAQEAQSRQNQIRFKAA